MIEISKSDWKLFREKVPKWQEHYMERLTSEYIELLSAPGNASDHFWELDKRIKEDRRHPGALIDIRRSNAIWDIASLVSDEVISIDELNEFSEEMINAVNLILRR